MRLCEHPDFAQAILRAAEHWRSRGLRPAVIEKDYYVTESLRELAWAAGEHVVFKGGTSLAKGWGLIERFSEDIDLFLDPLSYTPPLGAKRIDRGLGQLRDAVRRVPGLVHDPGASRSFKALGRADCFVYRQRFGAIGDVKNTVLLEAGIASGRQPTEERELDSLVAAFLRASGITLGTLDEHPFRMRLLHFRRTFVEKLFAIHGKVVRLERDRVPLGSYARHYYDLYQLAGTDEVRAMLRSAEYRAIQRDYDAISRRHFPRDYACPDEMDFSTSHALFPPGDLRERLGADYDRQCRQLCYGTPPKWNDVLARFEELRPLLQSRA
jgi:hypothetical protein